MARPEHSLTPGGELEHLRAARDSWRTPEEAIPWIRAAVLRDAGWDVYVDREDMTCARKEKEGLEIRVCRRKGRLSIGGEITEDKIKDKGFIADAQEAMKRLVFDGYQSPTMVRVSTTRTVAWDDIVAKI